MAEYKTKAIQFDATADSHYAGETRYLGTKLAASGRASGWCRHYHRTEAQAAACARKLAGIEDPANVELEP
jgi:hypothetical protein